MLGDIAPGEVVFISKTGELHRKQCAEPQEIAPCIFEHVYLARPDSIIDGISVHKARMRMGQALASKLLRQWPEHARLVHRNIIQYRVRPREVNVFEDTGRIDGMLHTELGM